MNSYQADLMALQERWFRGEFGTSVVCGGGTFGVTTAQVQDRKAGAEVFSHIGLDAYDAAVDSRVFEFSAADLSPTTDVAIPVPGATISWQGKDFTAVFSVPSVVGDVVKGLRIFAYYAGPVVNVGVLRKAATAKDGTGYVEAESALEGSPFAARVYRLRSNAYEFYQMPEGVATIERVRVAAFGLPGPGVQVGDVCVLPDGARGLTLRVRKYLDRVDADLEMVP